MKINIDIEQLESIIGAIAAVCILIFACYIFYGAGVETNKKDMFKQYILIDRAMVIKHGAVGAVVREGDVQYDMVVTRKHIRWEADRCK